MDNRAGRVFAAEILIGAGCGLVSAFIDKLWPGHPLWLPTALGWVGVAFVLLGLWQIRNEMLGWLNAIWRRVRPPKPPQRRYCSYEDEELSSAIFGMSWGSVWSRWFRAQALTLNERKPLDEWFLMQACTFNVTEALVDGRLAANGRPPGAIEYEDIPRAAWRLLALSARPDKVSLWRIFVIPRTGVDPTRVQKYLDYDSIIVNGNEFERLWPSRDKKYEKATQRMLKKAAKLGADKSEIERLRHPR